MMMSDENYLTEYEILVKLTKYQKIRITAHNLIEAKNKIKEMFKTQHQSFEFIELDDVNVQILTES